MSTTKKNVPNKTANFSFFLFVPAIEGGSAALLASALKLGRRFVAMTRRATLVTTAL
jgi:hypothetical protein